MKILTSSNFIIVLLLLLLTIGTFYHFNEKSKNEKKHEYQLKLNEALGDSVETFKNKRGEWESNKRTLQGKISELTSKNIKLNDDQKELFERLNEEKNTNKIFSAALIKLKVKIDSLDKLVANATNIDTVKNTISFIESDTTKDFSYDIKISNVRPFGLEIPTLEFNSIVFPNTQFIKFQWDENERKDYPVSFSISNSNKYFKVYNIESYAIPELNKETVKPNGWQKTWKWIRKNGTYILIGSLGYGIGKTL